MSLLRINTGKFSDSEDRRRRMEEHLRRLWGDEEIDFLELIHMDDEARKAALSKLPDGEKVIYKPEGSKDFVVFIDPDNDLDYITDESLRGERSSLISEIKSIENQPCKQLSIDEVTAFKRLLGGAIVCSIENALENAWKQADLARDYLRKRTIEQSRIWVLLSALIVALLLLITGVFIPELFEVESTNWTYPSWSIGLYFGMLGAFLSIGQRSGRRELDSAAGLWLHVLDVLLRFASGAITGALIIYISVSPLSPELMYNIANVSGGPQVLGFIAGFSDRLIPSIVSKYQTK